MARKRDLDQIRQTLARCRRNAESHRLVEWRRYYAGKAAGIELMLPLVEQLKDRIARAEETISFLLRDRECSDGS